MEISVFHGRRPIWWKMSRPIGTLGILLCWLEVPGIMFRYLLTSVFVHTAIICIWVLLCYTFGGMPLVMDTAVQQHSGPCQLCKCDDGDDDLLGWNVWPIHGGPSACRAEGVPLRGLGDSDGGWFGWPGHHASVWARWTWAQHQRGDSLCRGGWRCVCLARSLGSGTALWWPWLEAGCRFSADVHRSVTAACHLHICSPALRVATVWMLSYYYYYYYYCYLSVTIIWDNCISWHPKLRIGGFCWSKGLLPIYFYWWQLVSRC